MNENEYGLASIMPKAEGMKIPRKMVELYGFGVGINYPQEEFMAAYLKEFGDWPYGVDSEPKRVKQKLYSAEEITAVWSEYQSSHVWRVLRAGKWKVYFKKPDTSDGATRVDMVKASQVYTFPEYLEVVNG